MLLFGQLLAELYESNVLVFIGELRRIIEADCRVSILGQLEKKAEANAIRVAYSKIKSVLGKFVLRSSQENSVELLLAQLQARFPTVVNRLPSYNQSSALATLTCWYSSLRYLLENAKELQPPVRV